MRGEKQITAFDSVGCAVEEFNALRCIHNKRADTQCSEKRDLREDRDDPCDLFVMLERVSA